MECAVLRFISTLSLHTHTHTHSHTHHAPSLSFQSSEHILDGLCPGRCSWGRRGGPCGAGGGSRGGSGRGGAVRGRGDAHRAQRRRGRCRRGRGRGRRGRAGRVRLHRLLATVSKRQSPGNWRRWSDGGGGVSVVGVGAMGGSGVGVPHNPDSLQQHRLLATEDNARATGCHIVMATTAPWLRTLLSQVLDAAGISNVICV